MPALTNAVYAATAKRIRKLPVAAQLRGVGGSAKATLLEVNKVKARPRTIPKSITL